MSALIELPAAAFALVPELHELGALDEPRADCARCVMLPAHLGAGHPWAFHEDTRCCTYHPEVPNFLAGRALARGGASAEAIRARLGDLSGVSAWGIVPSERYRASRAATRLGFGRDLAMRCPFWVGGLHSCGIWKDRTSVCRTWFCKNEHGAVSMGRWTALRRVLIEVERVLAELGAATGAPHEDASAADWEAFFRGCAERVDRLGAEELGALGGERLRSLRRELDAAMGLPDPSLPEVVVPVVRGSVRTRRGLGLEGISHYDGIDVDARVVFFFAALDGVRTWREALELGRPAYGDTVDERVVRELGRVDILQAPARVLARAAEQGASPPPAHMPAEVPAVLVPAMQKPLACGDLVWLQGEVPLASVLAPIAIFRLLSRLDGTTPWRAALEAVHAEDGAPLNQAQVRDLYRIGALREP